MIGYRFVQDHEVEFDITRLCGLVEVPCSSFFAWVNRKPAGARNRVMVSDTKLLCLSVFVDAGRWRGGSPARAEGPMIGLRQAAG